MTMKTKVAPILTDRELAIQKYRELQKLKKEDSRLFYESLFEARDNALNTFNIDMLNMTYLIDEDELHEEEVRIKILQYQKVLQISNNDVQEGVLASLGFRIDEYDAFREMVYSCEDYKYQYLEVLVSLIEERLTDIYFVTRELSDKEIENALNILRILENEFNGYIQTLKDMEYINFIVEQAREDMLTNRFHSSLGLIAEIEDETIKNQLEFEYSQSINLTSLDEFNYDSLDEIIREQYYEYENINEK